ncbi:MAG TPA: phosphotransferase [Candidatus Polarisedimenticolaceae bacterium]|nr:phosphotransferase [Candidatus Polarisedimenticolaceae bacterium]
MNDPRDPVRRHLDQRFPGARIERLAGDASSRLFYRVVPADGPSVVVMDYGHPFDGETDDMIVGALFRRAGLRVAALLEASNVNGCLVFEDLGDRDLESTIRAVPPANGAPPPGPLLRAVELAAEVARRGTPVLAASDRAGGPALDAARFRFEMEFFVEHYVEGFLGRVGARERLAPALFDLADRAADGPSMVLCHRDFHSRNLMLPPDGSLAMVDIQDARWGPDGYDLASILRDAYIDLDEGWVDPLVDRYLDALDAGGDRHAFRRRLRLVAVQRMIKALGSFGYLTSHLATQRYLEPIPRTVRRLAAWLEPTDELRPLREAMRREELLSI